MQAYGKRVHVCHQECFAPTARAVYGQANNKAPVGAFVVQTLLSTMEGLDAGIPSWGQGSEAHFRCFNALYLR